MTGQVAHAPGLITRLYDKASLRGLQGARADRRSGEGAGPDRGPAGRPEDLPHLSDSHPAGTPERLGKRWRCGRPVFPSNGPAKPAIASRGCQYVRLSRPTAAILVPTRRRSDPERAQPQRAGTSLPSRSPEARATAWATCEAAVSRPKVRHYMPLGYRRGRTAERIEASPPLFFFDVAQRPDVWVTIRRWAPLRCGLGERVAKRDRGVNGAFSHHAGVTLCSGLTTCDHHQRNVWLTNDRWSLRAFSHSRCPESPAHS